MDTYFGYTDKNKGFFSSDEQRWINKIRKLAEEHPDEVRVIRLPENNDGCIYVQLPTEWLKIQPPRKSNMTEEQKDALRERMRAIRASNSQ